MRKKDKSNKKTNRANYNLEEIPSSKMKMGYYRKKRAQKRLKNTIFQTRFFIKILAILALLLLCSRIMVCHFWYIPQNAFTQYPNKHLRIIGNKITPESKILSALKSKPIPHKPIYLIKTSPYEKEIEKLSPVKRAFVRRYWLPARFEVTIEEEIPVITIAPNPTAPEIAALTIKGEVISKEYLPIDTKKYKTYKILTYAEYKDWTSEEIHHIQVLAQRIEDYSGEKLLYLDLRNKNDVFAQLETIKIRIGELNSTLKQRIERLSSIMPQIENQKRRTDYVDIRWDNTTYLKMRSKNSPPLPDPVYVQPQAPVQNTEKENKKPENPKTEVKKAENKPAQNKSNSVKPKEQPKTIQKTSGAPKVVQKKPTAPQPAKKNPQNVVKKQNLQELPSININVVEP